MFDFKLLKMDSDLGKAILFGRGLGMARLVIDSADNIDLSAGQTCVDLCFLEMKTCPHTLLGFSTELKGSGYDLRENGTAIPDLVRS